MSDRAWKACVVALVLLTLLTGGLISWVADDGTWFAIAVAVVVILGLAG